jgi:hypothetical protein
VRKPTAARLWRYFLLISLGAGGFSDDCDSFSCTLQTAQYVSHQPSNQSLVYLGMKEREAETHFSQRAIGPEKVE